MASNFTLSKGTVEGVTTVAGNAKEVLVSVKGLTYGDKTTVTVGNPAYTKEVTVPAVSDLFTLEVTTDAANDTIVSNGASKTQLTVTLKDKLTGEVVDKDGVIQFQSTDGGLGQTTSALVNGKASVQLTSVASPTSITSIITATVSDVPGAQEFKGLTAQKAVIFSPDANTGGVVEFAQVVSAESTQGDRLFVTFSAPITAKAYKEAINATTWNKNTSGYGIAVDGHLVNVKDVVQKTDKTLEFVLDTDLATAANSTSHTRIESGWNGAGITSSATAASTVKNYLRDNVQHKVTFPSNVGKLVLANTTGVNFILTDTSKPAVLGVSAKDQIEFTVRFTESVDERTVEVADGNIAANFLLDGKQVVVNANPTAGDIVTAKNNNRIIVSSLTVGNHTPETTTAAVSDTRNVVTFKAHPEFALASGTHTIQIANVRDWSGDVDPVQNTVVTDTFSFNVTADISKPAATVVVESPEQWLVTYNQLVTTTTGKVARDVFKIKTANTEDQELVYGTDFKVYIVDDSGVAGRELAAGDSITTASKNFLVEFAKDWSEKYNTKSNPSKTYFASTQNPYTLTLENVKSLVGNAATKQELNVNLAYDAVSPTVVSAVDVFTTATKNYVTNALSTSNAITRSTALTGAGKQVLVNFSEPVKVNSDAQQAAEGLTPSQDQYLAAGLPATTVSGTLATDRQAVQASTYEFVKGDKVVKANVASGSIAANDKSFVLVPEQDLEAGTWTLYIRGLSDDIGNTISTTSTQVTIVASTVDTKTQVAWAAFDDAGTPTQTTGKLVDSQYANKDVIYVKFTKVMKADGANGVASTQNYVFRGQALSTLGDEAQVIRGIKGVTNDWDGVTIVVPKGTWNGTDAVNGNMGTADAPKDNFTAAFNVAENFVSNDGEKLSGNYEFELTDTATTNTTLASDFEAVYTQSNGGTLGTATIRSAVKSAAARDVNANGKIDQITLTFDKVTALAAKTPIYVNGKKFISPNAVTTGSTVTFTNDGTTNEITGTSTANLVVKAADGSILVNEGNVIDNAAPVIKSAVQSSNGELKITFTENIRNTAAIAASAFSKATAGIPTPLVASPTTATQIGADFVVLKGITTPLSAGDTIDLTAATLATLTDTAVNPVTQAPIDNAAVALEGTATYTNDVKITGINNSVTSTGVTITGVNTTAQGKATVAPTAESAPNIGASAFGGFADTSLNGYTIEFKDDGNAIGAATATATLDETNKKIVVLGSFAGITKPSAANVQTAIRGLAATFTGLGKTAQATEVALITVTGEPTVAGTSPISGGAAGSAATFEVVDLTVATGATNAGNITLSVTITPAVGAPVVITTAPYAAYAGETAASIATGLTAALNSAIEVSAQAGNYTATSIAGKITITQNTAADVTITANLTN